MEPTQRRKVRRSSPLAERMEARLVMSGHVSVAAEIQSILKGSPGNLAVRPNTPILPLESPSATATYVDPTARVVQGGRVSIGARDLVAPYATLDATSGFIKVGTGSAIQDNATLTAGTGRTLSATGIVIGDNTLVGTGARVIGPAAIGGINGATTGVGAGATIDGAIISPGAFVAADATVGPGVTVPPGYEILPGMHVTNDVQASNPALGDVIKLAPTDTTSATTRKILADNSSLAGGYATLYQGGGATGGAASAGPVPSAVAATGSTIFFGALNTVLGVSSEPTSTRGVNFEAASGTPSFVVSRAKPTVFAAVAPNLSYRINSRIVGAVTFQTQTAGAVLGLLGRSDSIRADEGQPILIGSIARLGNHVSIHAPGGTVSTATTTTVNTVTQVAAIGATTTSNSTTVVTPGPATATAGVTTATTSGVNAAGQVTTGAVSTTITVKTINTGSITIGLNFVAGNNVTILGGSAGSTTIGNNVVLGDGSIVNTSTIGSGAFIGAGAYVSGSTVAPGAVVAPGEILVNNKPMGFVQP